MEENITLPELLEKLNHAQESMDKAKNDYLLSKNFYQQILNQYKRREKEITDSLSTVPDIVNDQRKTLNPFRNLKISARRVFEAAKRHNFDAETAKDRAYTLVLSTAKNKYNYTTIPQSVVDFIEELYNDYPKVDKVATS